MCRGWVLLVLGAVCFGAGAVQAQVPATPAAPTSAPPSEAPLFASEAPIELTLAMDMREVLRDRSEDPPYYPGTLAFRAEDGTDVRLATGVRTRGFFRLHHLGCDVPPLKLNLKEQEVVGTVFEGQDKLKLVTHCQNRSDTYERYVLLEHLLYKAYATLTDLSFRVRLARITYVDTDGRRDPLTAYGFLIEDEDAMAARNGGSIIEAAHIHPEAADRERATLLALFQYMIGNTDWGVWDRHNVKLVFLEEERKIVIVPYDFDWAGLISTRYATPSANLDIDSVEDRLYMGFCRSEAEFARGLAQLAAREQAIYDVFRTSPHLGPEAAADAVDYLEEFFDEVREGDDLHRALQRECLGSVD